MRGSGRAPVSSRIDWPSVARGASTGFTILVLGGFLTVIVARFAPALALPWLILVALCGLAVAGWRASGAAAPALNGMVAATLAYLLTLPLVVLQNQPVHPGQLAITVGAAFVLGGGAGHLAGRRRGTG